MAASTVSRNRFDVCRSMTLVSTRRRDLARMALLGSVALSAALGCGSDTTEPGLTPSEQLFYSFKLNYHAINLALIAPYDTVQLTAVARTGNGTVLSPSTPVQYIVNDSAISVSANGLMTAHYRTQTNNATVIAQLTVNGITLRDTAIVQVTPTPLSAPPTAVAMVAYQPDGTIRATDFVDDVFGNVYLGYTFTFADGSTGYCDEWYGCDVPLAAAFTSSDPNAGTVDPYGVVTPMHVGHLKYFVSTYAYGAVVSDSLPFVIGYPGRLTTTVNPDSGVTPLGINVTPAQTQPYVANVGASVAVTNGTTDPLEISVSPTGLGVSYPWAGNPNQLKDTLQYLYAYQPIQFDSAGTYTVHYRLLTSGATASWSVIIKPYP